jgi:hypothetical protein
LNPVERQTEQLTSGCEGNVISHWPDASLLSCRPAELTGVRFYTGD